MRFLIIFYSTLTLIGCQTSQLYTATEPTTKTMSPMQVVEGFFDFEWDASKGIIHMYVDKLDEEFLYVNSLAAGVGSNDLGLDRGQLGRERVVKFVRSGNKLLLTHVNYDYRAVSNNALERLSVEQAFAQSVLFGLSVSMRA